MALNDPNWGRRGGDGPPDLDELWNRLRQKLSPLFGGRGGGRGGAGPGEQRPFPFGVLILIGLVFVIWIAVAFVWYLVYARSHSHLGRHEHVGLAAREDTPQ